MSEYMCLITNVPLIFYCWHGRESRANACHVVGLCTWLATTPMSTSGIFPRRPVSHASLSVSLDLPITCPSFACDLAAALPKAVTTLHWAFSQRLPALRAWTSPEVAAAAPPSDLPTLCLLGHVIGLASPALGIFPQHSVSTSGSFLLAGDRIFGGGTNRSDLG